MAAWRRCLLRQISHAPALIFRSPSTGTGWRQRPVTRMTADLFRQSGRGRVQISSRPEAQKPNRRRRKQRHLYVVLEDDIQDGFAIHKLGGIHVTPGYTEPLPPPVVRVALNRGIDRTKPRLFAALGSSIVTTGTRGVDNSPNYGVTVIYDTERAALFQDLSEKAGLIESRDLPSGLFYGSDVAVAAGNRLYLLESTSRRREYRLDPLCYNGDGGMHCLKAADPNERTSDRDGGRWRPSREDSRFSWSSNTFPPELPFPAESVTAHAVNGRGSTIYVSTRKSPWEGTFSYSMATGEWKRRGEWLLPFDGPAHYDPGLDAWVGLYLDPEGRSGAGYLCASRVMTVARPDQPPEWKKVSLKDLSSYMREREWQDVINVQLLYMRERRKYCLMEHLQLYGSKTVLRLTVFRLSYGQDGELVVTTHPYMPAPCYDIPDESFLVCGAFWM